MQIDIFYSLNTHAILNAGSLREGFFFGGYHQVLRVCNLCYSYKTIYSHPDKVKFSEFNPGIPQIYSINQILKER